MCVRVTIEYDYEDPDAFDPEEEARHWKEGGIDVATLNDGDGVNLTVKAEKID
jgi:hypothetical protein